MTSFRENYAELLESEFRDELRESIGTAAVCMLWIRLIVDLAISVPLQLIREIAEDARHTVRLWSRRPVAPHDSAAQFHEWRRQSSYLADTALFEPFDVNLGSSSEWRRAHIAQVSSNFFSVLGAQPLLGRGFAHGEAIRKHLGPQFGSTELRLPSSVSRHRASIIPARPFSGSRQRSAAATTAGKWLRSYCWPRWD